MSTTTRGVSAGGGKLHRKIAAASGGIWSCWRSSTTLPTKSMKTDWNGSASTDPTNTTSHTYTPTRSTTRSPRFSRIRDVRSRHRLKRSFHVFGGNLDRVSGSEDGRFGRGGPGRTCDGAGCAEVVRASLVDRSGRRGDLAVDRGRRD